ncbi:MAG: 3-oxoacyl-[acyl-carrier protein] reductase, partial [uncultured Acetobacteraceae bacterium]
GSRFARAPGPGHGRHQRTRALDRRRAGRRGRGAGHQRPGPGPAGRGGGQAARGRRGERGGRGGGCGQRRRDGRAGRRGGEGDGRRRYPGPEPRRAAALHRLRDAGRGFDRLVSDDRGFAAAHRQAPAACDAPAALGPDHRGGQHRDAAPDPDLGAVQHATSLHLGLGEDHVGRGRAGWGDGQRAGAWLDPDGSDHRNGDETRGVARHRRRRGVGEDGARDPGGAHRHAGRVRPHGRLPGERQGGLHHRQHGPRGRRPRARDAV